MTTIKELREKATELHRSGQLEDAARAYASYLAQRPNDAGIWSNLGVLHRVAGRHRQALRAHTRAVALAPEDIGLMNNKANVLSDIGQYEDSIVLRREILKRTPDDANHKAMIGRCLRGQGKYKDAIAYLKSVIPEHPDDPELEMQMAFAQLGAGQYAEGLISYKARWRAGELKPRDLPFAEWQGEPLDGKTIVVLPEQGFGDAVLFARFIPILQEQGARVLAYIEKPLVRLMQGLAGADEVINTLTRDADIDYWVNMMDLAALHFGQGGDIPAPTTLNLPADAVTRARAISGPYASQFKVGVVWSGSATYKGNAFRSFQHTDFLPLTDIGGVQLFSLYKGPYLDAFYADGSDGFMIDAGASDRDFADCAAMMKQMDLIITSDTATAHIAGSLGVPVWTVLHWDAFWVFRHAGDETAWYPGMRLFRQKTPLEWGAVMSEVAQALRLKMDG